MKKLAVIGALSAVILVAGCGSSSKATVTSIPPVSITASTASGATVAPITTAAVGATTVAPATTPAAVTAPALATNIITISLTVGKDTSPSRVENIKLGSTVQVSLLNPTANDKFHLHGIDIEQALKAGEQGLISFVADKAGSYELESHVTNAALVTLVVT